MSIVYLTNIDSRADLKDRDEVSLKNEKLNLSVTGPLTMDGSLITIGGGESIYYIEGLGTLYGKDGWRLVSATREVPEWEPGTSGTGMVQGVARDGFLAIDPGSGQLMFFFPDNSGVQDSISASNTANFMPDDDESDDQRVQAWKRIVRHPLFAPCFKSDETLIDAMMAHLDDLAMPVAARTWPNLFEQGGAPNG